MCRRRTFSGFLCKIYNFGSFHSRRMVDSKVTNHAQYCMGIVRKFDHENYLSTLLLPKLTRASVFAIRALNVEVSQIQDTVSETQIGLMRIQFWRDALDAVFKDTPPESPITLELAKACQRHKLSKRWFTQMIDARESNLQNQTYDSLTQLEEYCDKAFSSPIFLILETLGIKDLQADHAASHIGKAIGITTSIRAIPYHAQRGRVYLPSNVMIQHEVSQELILRGSKDQNVKDAVYDIASSANNHLKLAKNLKDSLPKGSHLAFLSTASCEAYLKGLQRADFNVFDPRLQQRNNWLPAVLWLQKFKKTF